MYKASNNIKGYEAAGGGISALAAPQSPAADASDDAVKSKAPAWARK
jgi:hypothetical protein